jgi:para-nitrobenzyl esterase
MQSLSSFNTWCTQPPEQAVEIAKLYLEILKVETPADLMSIDADRLLAVSELLGQYFHPDKNVAWRPLGGVMDGKWIPELPVDRLVAHGIDEAGPKFEVMLGFAKDEWLLFRSNSETVKNGTNVDVLKVLAQVFDERASAVLEAYRKLNPAHSPGRLLSDIMSFEFCKYSTLEMARTFSAQDIPTYMFEFTYEMPGLGGALHAVHTGDMPFIWRTYTGNWPTLENANLNEVERVAHDFGPLYGAFIRNGDPGPRWERFGGASQSILWFGTVVETREGLLDSELQIFRKVGGIRSLDQLRSRLTANVIKEFAASKHVSN